MARWSFWCLWLAHHCWLMAYSVKNDVSSPYGCEISFRRAKVDACQNGLRNSCARQRSCQCFTDSGLSAALLARGSSRVSLPETEQCYNPFAVTISRKVMVLRIFQRAKVNACQNGLRNSCARQRSCQCFTN